MRSADVHLVVNHIFRIHQVVDTVDQVLDRELEGLEKAQGIQIGLSKDLLTGRVRVPADIGA